MNVPRRKPVRWLICLHESGHAVAAIVTGIGVQNVIVSPPDLFGNRCSIETATKSDEAKAITDAAGEACLEIYRPGIAAMLDEYLSPLGKVAMREAAVIYAKIGIDGSPEDDLPASDGQNIAAAVERQDTGRNRKAFLLAVCIRTIDILKANWQAVLLIAEELYMHGQMSGDRVNLIVRSNQKNSLKRKTS